MLHSYYFAKILHKMRLSSFKECTIDKTSKVDSECALAYVQMGRYSYVGSESHITSAKIGNFVSIGGKCQIGGGVHPLDMVSTSPVFLTGRNILRKNFGKIQFDQYREVVIGNDVWIGDGCYIKAGVTIGNGAVVGAHAVVTKDVKPYMIVAGSPAREIRLRFPEETVLELNRLEWWNWPDKKIKLYAHLFNDPEKLIEVVNGDSQ